MLDSHAFMESLEKDIEEPDSSSVVYSTRVVRVGPYDKQPGWVVQMVTENGEPDALLTRTLINSTGLSGPFILNSFLSRMNPPQPPLPMYYVKGSHILALAQAHQMCGISYTRCQKLAPRRTSSQDWGHTLLSIFRGISVSDT